MDSRTFNTDQATINQALAELRKRGVRDDCTRCGQKKWLAEIIAIQVGDLPIIGGFVPSFGSYLPALTMTCETCGCVYIHNLINLDVSK